MLVGNGRNLNFVTSSRGDGVVGGVAQETVGFVQSAEVGGNAESQQTGGAVFLAAFKAQVAVASHAESAFAAIPVGQQRCFHAGLRLVEAIGVFGLADACKSGKSVVGGDAVNHATVGNEHHIEWTSAVIAPRCAVVRIAGAVVAATHFAQHNGFVGELLEHVGGKAVHLVENLFYANIVSVAWRVNHVAEQHSHVVTALSAEQRAQNLAEVGVAGVAHVGCGGIDVFVLEEVGNRCVVVVDAVVHDGNVHVAVGSGTFGCGEEVDEVVCHLLQLATALRGVVGSHRTASLEIDSEVQRLLAVGSHVP